MVKSINIQVDGYRDAGVYITAITGVRSGIVETPPSSWRAYPESYFTQQKYFLAMDRLARRFYQFRDDIPDKPIVEPPEGYSGPKVRFRGNEYADLFTNVYSYNLHDMMQNKIDPDGRMHTSSKGSPSFGDYIGFGTYKNGVGTYYDQMWSRDVSRCMIELIDADESAPVVRAGEVALKFLYDKNPSHTRPNWKRVINASELNSQYWLKESSGKENDGHGAMMLFIARLVQAGRADNAWVENNWKAIEDAAEWYAWQMENPKSSGFDETLSSETEMANQEFGEFDLTSNTFATYGLRAFSRMAAQVGCEEEAAKWSKMADRLWQGLMNRFTTNHPRYGTIFVDTLNDCLTYEYKRFAPLFLMSDFETYDVAQADPALFALCGNTYQAQKEDYFSYASGRQLGYGQAYITEAAIMLDEYDDMRGFIEQAAAFCYHHTDYPYIVPESVVMHPSGRFWFRNGDLGNCAQQAEIIKCARLLIGLDDLKPQEGLKLTPRLPSGWTGIRVEDYPVTVLVDGALRRVKVKLDYRRIDSGYAVDFEIDPGAKLDTIRVGPFKNTARHVEVKGAELEYRVSDTDKHTFAYIDLSHVRNGRLQVKVTTR